jgi:hypothetical protein
MATLDEKRERERLRQAALDRLTLDDFADVPYDDLTHLAAAIFRTTIALISLIGSEREWFKSRVDRDDTGITLEAAFGNEAIKRPGEVIGGGGCALESALCDQSVRHWRVMYSLRHRRAAGGVDWPRRWHSLRPGSKTAHRDRGEAQRIAFSGATSDHGHGT